MSNEQKEREQMQAEFKKLFKYPMSDDFESETFERGWRAGRAALRAESDAVLVEALKTVREFTEIHGMTGATDIIDKALAAHKAQDGKK